MSYARNRLSTFIARFLLLAAIVCGLAAPSFALLPVNPTTFVASPPPAAGPIGFAYAGNKFVGSILDTFPQTGVNLLYSTNLIGGNVQLFGGGAPALAASYGQEHYVAASIGQGGFASGDVYVAAGNNIVHYDNLGNYVGLVVTGSSGPFIDGDVRGITFDSTGSFGGDMLVTTHTGHVYTITSTGTLTQIGFVPLAVPIVGSPNIGQDTEGLDVVPTTSGWGTLNGALFVASENSGEIHAILPTNTPGTPGFLVTTIASAEQVSYVPTLGGNVLEGMYSADYKALDVLHAPSANFSGLVGDIIVTTESAGTIYAIDPTFASTLVGNFPGTVHQPEDGVFVTAGMLVGNPDAPEPTTLAVLALGSLTLLTTRRRSRA